MSNGIQQSLETLGNLGNTFINSFSAGMQISQSLEKNKREKRQAGLNLLKKTQTALNDIFTTQGADAANQYMQTEAYQEAVQQLKNVGFDAELTPGGSFLKQVDYNTGLEIYMQEENLADSEDNREEVKTLFRNAGIKEGDNFIINLNYNGTGTVNLDETQSLQKTKLDITQKRLNAIKTEVDTFLKQTKTKKDKQLSGFAGTINALDELDELSKKIPDLGVKPLNALVGILGEKFGSELLARFDTIATIAGKQLATAFENGKISDKDYEVYKNALPSVSDTLGQRIARSKEIRNLLNKAQNTKPNTYTPNLGLMQGENMPPEQDRMGLYDQENNSSNLSGR